VLAAGVREPDVVRSVEALAGFAVGLSVPDQDEAAQVAHGALNVGDRGPCVNVRSL
jgi:hypothetical protein